MSQTVRALCKPELVKWAREQSRFPLEIAAKKINVSSERLSSWENGTTKPTINQLRNLSRIYRYPISFFYLPQAPSLPHPIIPDHRRLPDSGISQISPEITLEIRSVIEKREIYLELLTQKNEPPNLFQHYAQVNINSEALGTEIRNLFGVTEEIQFSLGDNRIAFNFWKQKVEDLGILVFQIKDVPINELRAFSIFFDRIPIIVLNRKDSYAGRMFSVLHELTHLMKRSSALCDMKIDNYHVPDDQATEIYCNHVAGSCLVPQDSLLNNSIVLRKRTNPFYSDSELKDISSLFSVSNEVILRRLLILGKTTQDYYEQKRQQWAQEYLSRLREPGYPTVPIDRVSLLGKPYVKTVIDSYKKEKITAHVLSDYLGAKLKHYNTIESIVG